MNFAGTKNSNKPYGTYVPDEPKSALTPDSESWLHVARQVIGGEFDQADDLTKKRLLIGLRSVPHPFCWKAIIRLLDDRTNGDRAD